MSKLLVPLAAVAAVATAWQVPAAGARALEAHSAHLSSSHLPPLSPTARAIAPAARSPAPAMKVVAAPASSAVSASISAPGKHWEVHKFGGASLADAALYIQCSELLLAESRAPLELTGRHASTMVIVSAKQGVTDKLIKVVEAALTDVEFAKELLSTVAREQMDIVREIANAEQAAIVEAQIAKDEAGVLTILQVTSNERNSNERSSN